MIEATLYALGMFALTLVNDIVWAWWAKTCTNEKSFQAATAAVGIYLMGGVSVLGYVGRPWLLIPACAGAFVGTYAATKWIKK